MIRLNLQMFAKGASQQSAYRKAKTISKYESMTKEQREEIKEKSIKGTKREEAVIKIDVNETYEVYQMREGREVPAVIDGKQVIRTGRQILDKFRYDKQRESWVSKAKNKKYIFRKHTNKK